MPPSASRVPLTHSPRSPALATPRSRRATNMYQQPSTPSRAMAVAFQSLPNLCPRPYKETHYTDDDDDTFVSQLERDALEIEQAITRLGQAISERKRDLAATVAELDDQKRSSAAEIRALIERAKEVKLDLSKEVEDQREARLKTSEVTQQERHLAGQIDSLNNEVEEERRKLRAKRERNFHMDASRFRDLTTDKSKQREAFTKQASKNGPECTFFEQKTGLKIEGRGRDKIHFKFTNIDRRNYGRPFSFVIDVSQPAYEVTSIMPINYISEQVLSSLLSKLNEDRNLYAFLRSMREEFRHEVELEYPNKEYDVEKEYKRATEPRVLKERN
ncbi:BZ3500_MvSof-1268-A1-R1_Chr1-1g01040 [Microbotryum saponariae]|uniref:Kinetochore protein SPC25 n=1 Tax=Microbotryum saponariae TaxID=289078 RepID=A0A2X0MBP8_9BASI|nr:BZ3500_MvSof-1268-A1-R1_Chr1-1g01040 [Microbotryum saponariae]SCZ93266.1 BZ3501_MvSof-1269-A2-R1_Chr1-1g00637 [Microbotryum saponariae]